MSGKKGMKHKNKRKPMSEAQKKQISETLKKRWTEEEYKTSMSKAHSHPLTDEWKQNIAWSRVGVKFSNKTRKNMSEAQRKISHRKGIEALQNPEIVKKRNKARKQFLNSPEGEKYKRKISKSLKKFYQTPEGIKKRKQSSVIASKLALEGKIISSNTSIERKVEKELSYYEIPFVKQKYIESNERTFIVDFYIPSLKLVIECNGDYWHSLPHRIQRDKDLKKYVERSGHKIIFIWEHEINDEWFDIMDYIGEFM